MTMYHLLLIHDAYQLQFSHDVFLQSFFSFYRIPGRLPGSFIFLLLTRARIPFIFLQGPPFFQNVSLNVHFLKIFLSVVDLSPLKNQTKKETAFSTFATTTPPKNSSLFFFWFYARLESSPRPTFHLSSTEIFVAKLVPLPHSNFPLNSAVGAWITTKADKRWVTGKCLFSCVLILLNFR